MPRRGRQAMGTCAALLTAAPAAAMSDVLDLVIPCRPADAKEKASLRPVHVYLGKDETGAAMTEWRCPHCGMQGPRSNPIKRHMGLVMNVPAGCPVLRAQAEARRLERAPAFRPPGLFDEPSA